MKKLLCLFGILIVQGCAIAPSAYLANTKAGSTSLVATDSRVRVIAEKQIGVWSTTGVVDPKTIVCTEPSPDVATTLANSLGLGVSVFGRGSASITAQQVEGLVQLGERTAAIQLIRDKMYQTCLAYSNGAITGTTYSLVMNRLDDAIVTLSLGDSAAGAFGRKLAGIGGEAIAKADAALTGLPGDMAKIDEQAGKLAASNKKVDDIEKALRAHEATKPEEGKQEEYNAQTTKLKDDLANAKGERNALLELMRSMARNASEVSGKISQLQTGGGLTARPDAEALHEMQVDFLLADVNRDFIFACLVELGLRADSESLGKSLKLLEDLFVSTPNDSPAKSTAGVTYFGGLVRAQNTALKRICELQLPTLLLTASNKFQEYRMTRSQLNANVATARYAGDAARASARDRELFIDSIKFCKAEFKSDAPREKACLDQVVPIKAAAGPPSN
jgi:hypothetical protein